MTDINFADELCRQIVAKESILCCGLDPQIRFMPPHLIEESIHQFGNNLPALRRLFYEFNRAIIDEVCDLVVCVKPNLAFYEMYGSFGMRAYEETVDYAHKRGLLVIADGKRGDGGDTAEAYADGYIGRVPFFTDSVDPVKKVASFTQADCLTVNGYIGEACLKPFIERVKEYGTGIFVVTKTSFKPSSAIEDSVTNNGLMVWQKMAKMVAELGENTKGTFGLRNVGVVLGATFPEDASLMRAILPDSIFLIPGFGGQGATADDAVKGVLADGLGGIVNNSRNLIYAWQNKKGKYQCASEDFAKAARLQALNDRNALNDALKKAGKWPIGNKLGN